MEKKKMLFLSNLCHSTIIHQALKKKSAQIFLKKCTKMLFTKMTNFFVVIFVCEGRDKNLPHFFCSPTILLEKTKKMKDVGREGQR